MANTIKGRISARSYINGTVDKPTNVHERELRFLSYKDFPAIGEEDILYIATNENAVYIFNPKWNIYEAVGRDYQEITAIQ